MTHALEIPERESDYQRRIIDLAKTCGWRVMHIRDAPTRSGGYATPVTADGKGWPDLTLCRGADLLFIEVKAAKGKLSEAQERWLDALAATGAEVFVCRPSDWDLIQARLTAPRSLAQEQAA